MAQGIQETCVRIRSRNIECVRHRYLNRPEAFDDVNEVNNSVVEAWHTSGYTALDRHQPSMSLMIRQNSSPSAGCSMKSPGDPPLSPVGAKFDARS